MAGWSTPRRCRNRSLAPRTRCFMSPLRRDTSPRLGGAGLHNARRLVRLVLCAALLAPVSHTVCAFTITISNGPPKTVYLQVGVGGFTGQYNAGGTPANNATVNQEFVSVAAAAVGNGTAQAMTTDSTVGASSYDGFLRCNVPAQLYIGGFYRTPGLGATGSATVTAIVPAALVDTGGYLLPLSRNFSAARADTGTRACALPPPDVSA